MHFLGSGEPVGAARLVSTSSRRSGLGSGLPSDNPDGFPEFGRCGPGRLPPGGQIYQGSALPLSYGSEAPNFFLFHNEHRPSKGVLPNRSRLLAREGGSSAVLTVALSRYQVGRLRCGNCAVTLGAATLLPLL